MKLEGNEPNETFDTAIPVEALENVVGNWDYLCDKDLYRFEGRAGDVFPVHFPNYRDEPNPEYLLFDGDRQVMYDVNVLPADGTYYLLMQGWYSVDGVGGCLEEETYTFSVGYPLWISTSLAGLPTNGHTPITPSDIVMRATEPGKWQLVFDGSDVGITTNIDAIEKFHDDDYGTILMSLGATQQVPGLGKVTPQDIIRFLPTSLGENTAGSFQWYLDGSDVGLTTAGENIDAMAFNLDDWNSNVDLVVSIARKGSVPRNRGGNLPVFDEDLITFVSQGLGRDSKGKWWMVLDGSDLKGMAAEDISAATYIDHPSPNTPLLLAFDSAFNIGGIKGGPNDIVDLTKGILVKNLTVKPIDAMTVGVPVP